jgi:DNA-binding NtrC family response regulator
MGKLILLTDDDSEDIELMAEALAFFDVGHACWTFNDPHKAIKHLSKDAVYPDFVFLDMKMPKLNGEDLLIELRKIRNPHKTKMIMYSTACDNQLVERLAKQKAASFQKPSTLADLHMILQHALDQ